MTFFLRVLPGKIAPILFATTMALVLHTSCKKDDEKGKSGKPIGAPEVEPPVSRNVPSGLQSTTSLRLDEASDKAKALAAVKQMLAEEAPGPSTLIYRLKMIDSRMKELDRRASESPVEKACLLASVVSTDYDNGGKLPGNEATGMKFQCQEEITESPAGIAAAQLAFGLTDDAFYLMERTLSTNNTGIMTLAKAAKDGKGTEAWQIGFEDNHASFRHIRAKDGVGLEATVANSKITSEDSGCGLHLKTNGTLGFIKGRVFASGTCGGELTLCFDAATGVETATDNCTAAGLETFELTSLTTELAQSSVADAKAMIEKSITGFVDFTKDAPVPDVK